MTNIPKAVKVISTLGLLPFFFGVVGSLELDFFSLELNKLLVSISLLYSGLILSFLGGCLFSFEVLAPNPKKTNLWLAILPTLWALVAVQVPTFSGSLLAIGFLIVLEIDRRAFQARKTPNWWMTLRLPITSVVIFSLVVIGFNV